jgi:hypothetical protein
MTGKLEIQRVDLTEIGKIGTSAKRKEITAYLAEVSGGKEEQFEVVRMLPPTGYEFADLILQCELLCDFHSEEKPVPIAIQRALRHSLKAAGGLKDLYPNEGMPSSDMPWAIDFMAPRPLIETLLALYEHMIIGMGDNAVAPRGSHKALRSLTVWGAEITSVFRLDDEVVVQKRLDRLFQVYERLSTIPKAERFVPNDIRYRLLDTPIIHPDITVPGCIDEVMVMRLAIIVEMADPCFFRSVEMDLNVARSPMGVKHEVIANAKSVTLPNRQVLVWEDLAVKYLAEMRRVYPWYWTRLPNAKRPPYAELSWDPLVASV